MNRMRWMALLSVFAMIIAACGGGDGAATTTTAPATTTTAAPETTTTTAPEEPVELLIWADENRTAVVEAIAPAFTAATGVTIRVQTVDFGSIRDQVGVAGPAGEGPDIFAGAHDWTGELAADGTISALDLGAREGDFFDVALNAFNFEGQLFAVPYAIEAIAMYYNTDLVAEAPTAFEDLGALCEAAGTDVCVGIPGGGDGADAYHNYPFVSALGGYIFAYDADSGYDPSDVGLDSDASIAGVEFLAEQVAAGVIEPTNYDNAKNLFLEGQAPFWITGPWERATLEGQDAVNWAVTKLPTIGGQSPAPFVGSQGFFLSAFSENALVAQSFLLDFIATQETQQALYDADPRGPAHMAVADALASDPVALAFAASAADGNPMPNIPQMGSVWGPLGDNLLLVRNGTLSAAEAMAAAADAVRAALAS